MYDMVLSLGTLNADQAAGIICDAADYPKFQAMTYSRKCLDDFALASKVRQKLMGQFPDIRLQVSDGTVVAHVVSLSATSARSRRRCASWPARSGRALRRGACNQRSVRPGGLSER